MGSRITRRDGRQRKVSRAPSPLVGLHQAVGKFLRNGKNPIVARGKFLGPSDTTSTNPIVARGKFLGPSKQTNISPPARNRSPSISDTTSTHLVNGVCPTRSARGIYPYQRARLTNREEEHGAGHGLACTELWLYLALAAIPAAISAVISAVVLSTDDGWKHSIYPCDVSCVQVLRSVFRSPLLAIRHALVLTSILHGYIHSLLYSSPRGNA